MSKPGQQSMFPELALPTPSNVIEVLVREKPVGKAQSAFRRLVEKIASNRHTLERWCAYEERYRQRILNELHPLDKQLQAGQREMVFLVDTLLSAPTGKGKAFGKTDRRKLLHIVLTLAEALLENTPEDVEVERIHDKYADISHADSRELMLEMEKSMFEQVFGMDMSDYDESEDLIAFAQAKLRQEAQADADARETKKQRKSAEKGPSKQEQAAREASLSVREVYRKLASALHPDRETDPDERERKTALMQRVNSAYEANDLLTLLNLQLEIEQIDAEHILSLPESRLKHYMQVLRGQLKELQDEIAIVTRRFSWSSSGRSAISPEQVDGVLSMEIVESSAMIRSMQNDLVSFRDPLLLRQWLKEFVIPREEDAFYIGDMPFDEPSLRSKKRKRRG